MQTPAVLADHFSILVYPFEHGLHDGARGTGLDRRWRPWSSRYEDERLPGIVDHSHFFLPHVRSLLFPDAAAVRSSEPGGQVVEMRAQEQLPLAELAKRIGAGCAPRLTLRAADLQRLDRLVLREHGGFCIPFAVRWIDVMAFPQRVGLLLMKVELREEEPAVRDVVSFLYHLRLVQPPALGWALARWEEDGGLLSFEARDLVDYALQGLTPGTAVLAEDLESFCKLPRSGRHAASPSTTDKGYAYGGTFRLFTYCRVVGSEAPGRSDVFESSVQQTLYELATVTDTSDPDYEPGPEWLHHLVKQGYIAFWNNWHGMALHDNVVFGATRQSRFTRSAFIQNVEFDYFPLYLLTVFQKIRLSRLTAEIVQQRGSLYHNARDAQQLRTLFLRFRTNYWFAEVTSRPQGRELYARFRRGLDLLPLYEAIDSAVHEMDEYYEGKLQRRINAVLTLLTLVGVPAGILASVFGPVLVRHATVTQFAAVAVTVYAIIAAGWLLWRYLARES